MTVFFLLLFDMNRPVTYWSIEGLFSFHPSIHPFLTVNQHAVQFHVLLPSCLIEDVDVDFPTYAELTQRWTGLEMLGWYGVLGGMSWWWWAGRRGLIPGPSEGFTPSSPALFWWYWFALLSPVWKRTKPNEPVPFFFMSKWTKYPWRHPQATNVPDTPHDGSLKVAESLCSPVKPLLHINDLIRRSQQWYKSSMACVCLWKCNSFQALQRKGRSGECVQSWGGQVGGWGWLFACLINCEMSI